MAERRKKSLPPDAQLPTPEICGEVVEINTRILRLALAVDDSWIYWRHGDLSKSATDQVLLAFEQRWFGSKSLERVRYLLGSFAARFDAFPSALAVLQKWSSMDQVTRQLICHWHLQLSDPIYRKFSGEFLVQRRTMQEAKVDRDAVLRWVRAEYPDKWSEATLVQFASKLLSAALEAGLVSKGSPRSLLFPKVTDHALAYLFYLLRENQFAGTLTENPYLRSVGLNEDLLAAKAHSLPGLSMRKMMHLVEFEWSYPDLKSWSTEVM